MFEKKPWCGNQLLRIVALGGLIWLSCGCGSDAKLVPVSGKVAYTDGKPVTSGYVTYKPDKSKGNKFGGEPLGEINAQGEYTLQTRGKPGAPLGAYKIIVTSTGAPTPDNTKVTTEQQINMTYANVDTTPLNKEVVASPTAGHYDLKVDR